jgi:hypothetical protein
MMATRPPASDLSMTRRAIPEGRWPSSVIAYRNDEYLSDKYGSELDVTMTYKIYFFCKPAD